MSDIQTLNNAAYDAQSLNTLKREVSGNPQVKRVLERLRNKWKACLYN